MKELIIWLSAATAFGILEGILFHYKNKFATNFLNRFKFDIHIVFGLIRLILFVPLVILTQERLIFILTALFMFAFIHDGFYYTTRWILSKGKIYKKLFFDSSTTTTAILSLSAFWRLILFIFGLGMIFVL